MSTTSHEGGDTKTLVISNENIDEVVDAVDRLSLAKPNDVVSIAVAEIKILQKYYAEVLEQARSSFKWALVAAGIGLLFFLASVAFILFNQQQSVATISLISGALIEVISAINFYLYGKTSAQLANFRNSLDLTQRFLLANSICEALEGEFKNRARAELVKVIAGVNSVEIKEDKSTKKNDGVVQVRDNA
jgi:hypothetical protein